MPSAAALLRLARDGVVHEDAPHRLRRDGEEVRAVLPLHPVETRQLRVGLVRQRGRIQSVIAPFPAQRAMRQPPQLVVDDRHEIVESPRVRHA